jgi:hypothetical protein
LKWHWIQIATIRALVCVWSVVAIACSAGPSNPLLYPGESHGMDSFMGVHFGDTFDQVELRFPTGMMQTSPYGAPAFRLENATSRNIEYQDVIYEFSPASGMQLVIAHFAPSAGPDVYQQLQSTLGAPSSTTALTAGPVPADASWRRSDGTRVLFSRGYHRLVLIGKDGGALETDIRLRDQFIPGVS